MGCPICTMHTDCMHVSVDGCRSAGGERTVKKLRLSKALTIPEGTTVSDACRRMAARRVDAVLLTDANALLSGIVTDKVKLMLSCGYHYISGLHFNICYFRHRFSESVVE